LHEKPKTSILMPIYGIDEQNLMLEAEQIKPEPILSGIKAEKPLVLELPKSNSRASIRPPFRVLWREFRFRFLPAVAFLLAVLGAIVVWRQWVSPQEVSPAASTFAGDSKPIPFNPVETVAGK
jgi:hypothetical protein